MTSEWHIRIRVGFIGCPEYESGTSTETIARSGVIPSGLIILTDLDHNDSFRYQSRRSSTTRSSVRNLKKLAGYRARYHEHRSSSEQQTRLLLGVKGAA